jgi:tetratricopeptide (TPR) repeat protein
MSSPSPLPRADEPPDRCIGDRAALAGPLGLAAILLLGALAYTNALWGAFVFDDVRQFRDHPLVRDLGAFVAGGAGYHAFPTRWVAYLTFALNHRLNGLHPLGWHLVNVVIHLANAALVYALVVLAFRTPRLRESKVVGLSAAIAFLASAVFVAHPIQTQAVAYVVQRLTSLATTFYLLTVVLYALFRLRDEAGRATRAGRIGGGLLVLATAALAMNTKEIAFTLPFAVALFEVSFFPGTLRARLVRLAPVLATLPIVPATLLLSGAPAAGILSKAEVVTRLQTPMPRLAYLATEMVVIVKYLGLLLLPVGQNLDHDVAVQPSLLAPAVLARAALLLAIAAAAVVLHRRAGRAGADPALRLVAFGVFWFFLALAVESSVVPIVDVMYEHRVYLPSAGLFVALATGAALLAARVSPARAERALLLGGAALALVLSVATVRRNAVWANDVTLWADAAAKSPEKPRPLLNLGAALAMSGRPQLGVGALRKAVGLDPASSYARAQLATALLMLGRSAEAEPELREALRLAPADPEATYNLATMLWLGNRREEARGWYRRFLEIAPETYASARRVASARAAARE